MANDSTKLVALTRGVNLEAVLETAEMVAEFTPIPFLPIIIKILKYLVKITRFSNTQKPKMQ